MNTWNDLHITDKNGGTHWKTKASPMSTISEIRNLKKHIEMAKIHPKHYAFLDGGTAIIVMNGVPYLETENMSDDELLEELGK